jgi:hypothetical protein
MKSLDESMQSQDEDDMSNFQNSRSFSGMKRPKDAALEAAERELESNTELEKRIGEAVGAIKRRKLNNYYTGFSHNPISTNTHH